MQKYTVVEFSGQDRANEVKTFDDYGDAVKFIKRTYSAAELDRDSDEYMDVGLRADNDDGSCEYVS